jgi:hypothetical protein
MDEKLKAINILSSARVFFLATKNSMEKSAGAEAQILLPAIYGPVG